MTLKHSHSTSSFGIVKSRKLIEALSPYVPVLVLIYQLSETGKAFNSIIFKSLFLVQMVLYFSNSLTLRKEINLLCLYLKNFKISGHFR